MLSNREQELLRSFFKEMPFEDVADVAQVITKRNLTPKSHEGRSCLFKEILNTEPRDLPYQSHHIKPYHILADDFNRIGTTLVSLCLVQGMMVNDAICIICLHSECVEEVLAKRKVTKRYLSEYLHKSNVSILNSWDKTALIRKIMNFWKLEVSSSSLKDNAAENVLPEENQTTLPQEALRGEEYYSTLCYEFSKWYYSLLNDDDVSKLGPEHFFDESQMQVALLNGDSTDTIEASNSNHAAETLRGIKVQFNLKFLPNLAPGAVQFEHDIHGQVKLFVSGTLHSNVGEVVGVFEQKFLLIRDFADNENWKIKKSQVVLRSANNQLKSSSTMNNQNLLSLCSSSGTTN